MNNSFTERDAILFEMQELKEIGRREFDLYFEMRKHRNQRYNELQNRLREMDEIDFKRSQLPPIQTEKQFTPKNQDSSVMDLSLERIKTKDTKTNRPQVSMDKILYEVEQYLIKNGESKKRDIQTHIEAIFNTKWVNFSSTLKALMKHSKHIKINKVTDRKYLYYYI